MRTVVILFWAAVLLSVAGRADTQQAVPAAEPNKPASRVPPGQRQIPTAEVPAAEPNKPSSAKPAVEKTESNSKQEKEAKDKKETKTQKQQKKSKPHESKAARDQGIVPGSEPHP